MTGKGRAPADGARRRPAVTLDALVRAALVVLERDGLDALSMRSVAAELGVRAPSLYWHVRDKEELLDLLADGLLGLGVSALPPLRGDWRIELRELAWAFRAFLNRRRDSVRVLIGRFPTGPGMAAVMEHQLAMLDRAGFDRQDAAYITYGLSTLVTGFVYSEQRPVSAAAAAGVPIGEAVGAIGDTIEALPADTYPHLVATARELTGPGIDARFEFVLERFLDGLAILPRTTRADPDPSDPTDPTGSPEPTDSTEEA
ncbi:TetR/AcrR family transcriptional regulator (plasmid) [Embleya sp. NBC_00888]|uniref:TetR/AcrR family transcriptional regulator n=1 Tax=Embleya sp. NBC_00888 TaxID=2975960 RepID=UPI002F91169B|nr:TetR/AcrR family transcriptional regulator [Embleya sp. NBC_00888]